MPPKVVCLSLRMQLYLKTGFYRDNHKKMRSFRWAFIQYNFYIYKRDKFEHKNTYGDMSPVRDIQRRWLLLFRSRVFSKWSCVKSWPTGSCFWEMVDLLGDVPWCEWPRSLRMCLQRGLRVSASFLLLPSLKWALKCEELVCYHSLNDVLSHHRFKGNFISWSWTGNWSK